MIIQYSQTIADIIKDDNMKFGTFADNLVANLIQRECIYDEDTNYGVTLKEALLEDTYVNDVIQAIKASGIKELTSAKFDAIMGAKLLGEFDCPYCGGETELIDCDEEWIGGDGYETPYEYRTTNEHRRCTCCGEHIYN